MKNGDRIIMLTDDGWAQKGWTGTVRQLNPGRPSLSVSWDNGKRLSHQIKDVALISAEKDPNVAFRMHKYNKKG